ncbi:hypothetical protein ASPZODRAFT_90642 [Penicilliopsis zonata CBS 506.65]|uniref:25S rRNA (uridine-N(3))-methyltransferase BMT5-like domain-containing protein n=1 Tax=Penicilliopsis zonata CBS 506.65 TaxID=1073090 RepID=A0A1L9SP32_9EURO|nr:hypothetical protein ASPZODRAFT_90642 [Penicilliopsis zonata CBS 506.65]OJJ48787.1 hypothetical protein ASPZODRAFT_90642 [Penicilliopsis zonata CBS 506.65]
MAKAKKTRGSQHGPRDRGVATAQRTRKMHTFARLSSSSTATTPSTKKPPTTTNKKQHRQLLHSRPVIPFNRRDRILLVGEGDFSFARSLVLHHKCRNVLATCYDSRETLFSKYPQAEDNITAILAKSNAKSSSKEEDGKDDTHDHEDHSARKGPRMLFSVDARKLGLTGGGGKEVRSGLMTRKHARPAWKQNVQNGKSPEGGPWDVICFNFPHVGGISTDVNRQVRSNQELLVAFFKACVPLLSLASGEDGASDDEDDEDDFSDYSSSSAESSEADEGKGSSKASSPPPRTTKKDSGQIVVTLFEGEPYTLWNIKDLARHAGLHVVTSFKFPWASYREYSHARTLGEVESKHGGRGGWRGEDREARSYVFGVKGNIGAAGSSEKKRRRNQSSDTDSD